VEQEGEQAGKQASKVTTAKLGMMVKAKCEYHRQ